MVAGSGARGSGHPRARRHRGRRRARDRHREGNGRPGASGWQRHFHRPAPRVAQGSRRSFPEDGEPELPRPSRPVRTDAGRQRGCTGRHGSEGRRTLRRGRGRDGGPFRARAGRPLHGQGPQHFARRWTHGARPAGLPRRPHGAPAPSGRFRATRGAGCIRPRRGAAGPVPRACPLPRHEGSAWRQHLQRRTGLRLGGHAAHRHRPPAVPRAFAAGHGALLADRAGG